MRHEEEYKMTENKDERHRYVTEAPCPLRKNEILSEDSIDRVDWVVENFACENELSQGVEKWPAKVYNQQNQKEEVKKTRERRVVR